MAELDVGWEDEYENFTLVESEGPPNSWREV